MLGWISRKLKSPPISTTYDSYNHEAQATTTHSGFSGLKFEISKAITPFVQLTAIRTAHSKASQIFTTFSLPSSVFQLCFDTNRSYQLKSSGGVGPITAKIHAIVSSKNETYAQLEAMYNSRFYNIGFKIISPALQASNLIYIVNCWHSFGRLCLGAEIVGMDNELGVSVASRVESKEAVYCLSLQRCNMVTASFYRRVRNCLGLGVEVQKSASYFSAGVGARLRTFRTDLKCTIDQRMRIGFEWDEKFTEKLTVNFSGTLDEEGGNYGLGMYYEA